MKLDCENPKSFASGQSVTWMRETSDGSIVPVQVKVVNVINDRVMIRIVKQPEGAVYFRSVSQSSLQGSSPLRSTGEVMKPSDECCH